MDQHETSGAALAPARWKLTDLIDVQTLQSIQDTFATVFGLPTVIVDPDGRNLTEITQRLPFCEDLTRTTELGGARCADCDLKAMRTAAATGRPCIFHCWNGLHDSAVPIAPEGTVLGYFLCGQILTEPADVERYRRTAHEIGVDGQTYVDALHDVRVVDKEKYAASVRSMYVLADMIASQAAAGMDNYRMLRRAADARDEAAGLLAELDLLRNAFGDLGSVRELEGTLDAVARHLSSVVRYDACTIYLREDDRLVPRLVRPTHHEASAQAWAEGLLGTIALTRQPVAHQPTTLDGNCMLAVPLCARHGVSGVLTAERAHDRPFSEREMRLASMLASQASVSIQASALFDELQERLREERLLGQLSDDVAASTTDQEALSAIAAAGLSLTNSTAILVETVSDGRVTQRVAIGIDDDQAQDLVDALGREARSSFAARQPVVAAHGGRQVLVVPLTTGQRVLGLTVFVEPARTGKEMLRAASTLAAAASVGIDRAQMCRREQRLSVQHWRLSELGTDLLRATERREVEELLLESTPRILDAEVVGLAFVTEGPTVHVRVGDGGRAGVLGVDLSRSARLAAAQLRNQLADDGAFTPWIEHIGAELSLRLATGAPIWAPLSIGRHTIAGLLCGRRGGAETFRAEDRQLLDLVATASSASLAQIAALTETDSSLRRRLAEMQVVNNFAERIAGVLGERPIIDELVLAFKELAEVRSAFFLRRQASRWKLLTSATAEPDQQRRIQAALAAVPEEYRWDGLDVLDGDLLVLTVGSADQGLVVGPATGTVDTLRREALQTLARHAQVALENARLHQGHRRTIARLERANEEVAHHLVKLRRLLSLHETLSRKVLSEGGVPALARELTELLGADVAVVGTDGEQIVTWGRSDPPPLDDRRLMVEGREGGRALVDEGLLSIPATIGDETIAWIFAARQRPFEDVDLAVAEYGALVVALALLRERTAVEVETRLKGGFLEDLFSGSFTTSHIYQQGLAHGIDLQRPGHVIMLQPTGRAASEFELNLLSHAVANALREAGRPHVLALLGERIIGVVADEPDDSPLEGILHGTLPTAGALEPNMSIGTLCTAPEDYRESRAAARRGLGLLAIQGRRSATFSFAEAGIAQLMLRSAEPEALLSFVRRYLDPINSYDDDHAVDLRQTLVTLYDADLNLQEAARRLHIHVSTLRYRLSQAAKLLGADPREGQARLEIEMALRAAEILSAHAI